MFVSRSTTRALRRYAPAAKARPLQRGSSGASLRRATLGVELRGDTLYLACVRPGLRVRQLTATGVIPGFAQISAEELRTRIGDLLTAANVHDPQIVLGIPRRELMVRHLELPAVAARQLDSVLQLQLGLYKPSDDEELAWDAAVVEQSDKLGIDLAFAPMLRIRELAARFSEAGYPVSRITTSQFATLEWLLRARNGSPNSGSTQLLVLQASANDVDMALVDGRRCIFSRSFTIPPSADSGAYVATQVRQALAANRRTADQSWQVIIGGDDSKTLRAALEAFGPVEHIGTSLQGDVLSNTVAEAQPDAPHELFWGALALALDGLNWTGDYHVNLLPRTLRPARRRWQHVPTVVLLVANVLMLGALVARGPIQRRILLKRYDAELTSLDKQATLVEREIKKSDGLQDRLTVLRDFQQQGRQPLDALSDLAQKLPADAWINAFTYHQGQVEVLGLAKSASALVPALKQAPSIEDVQLKGALTREADGERFQMQLKLRASR